MRLGAGLGFAEPFPKKPLGMHRRTYLRLRLAAGESTDAVHSNKKTEKQSYIVSDELPRGGRPTTSDAHLAAVRSEHLATFPDAGPREEGPQDHQVR